MKKTIIGSAFFLGGIILFSSIYMVNPRRHDEFAIIPIIFILTGLAILTIELFNKD
jgi:uncharacterized membrane protein YesL